MAIVVIGISHNNASLELLEQINAPLLSKGMHAWFPRLFIEWAMISTCNRTEMYVVTNEIEKAETVLKKLFKIKTKYVYYNQQAVKHLFYVASGADSIILGETEILAQIKQSYRSAIAGKMIGPILHELYKESLKVGKRARHNTGIGVGMISLAQIAITVVKKRVKAFDKEQVLVIGAGMMGQKVVKSLLDNGFSDITVANRTYDKAHNLADKFKIEAVNFDELEHGLQKFDVIICVTSSPTSLIKRAMLKKAMQKRALRSLCIIDLAVPRNVDKNVTSIPNVSLYNIDDLQKLATSNVKKRKKALSDVEQIIDEEVEKFWRWYLARRSVPLVTALNRKAEEVHKKELELALNKLDHLNLSQREKNIIAQLSRRVANKMIAKPIARIKYYAQKSDTIALQKFSELFDPE
jgi:glutamyl-tRNA reductase